VQLRFAWGVHWSASVHLKLLVHIGAVLLLCQPRKALCTVLLYLEPQKLLELPAIADVKVLALSSDEILVDNLVIACCNTIIHVNAQ